MEKKTLLNTEGYSTLDKQAKCSYCIKMFSGQAVKLDKALNSVDRNQGNFEAFMTTTGFSRSSTHHYEVLLKIFEHPMIINEDPNFPRYYKFIAHTYPEVLPTIAIAVEAKMLIIEPGRQPFPYDPSKSKKTKEPVQIAPKLTGPSPERIQQIFANFRRVADFKPPKADTVTQVLPKMMKRMRMRITANKDEPVYLFWSEVLDTYAIHRMVESVEFPHVIPSVPLNETTCELNPREFGVTHSASFFHPAIPSSYEPRLQLLRSDPVFYRPIKERTPFEISSHFGVRISSRGSDDYSENAVSSHGEQVGATRIDAADIDPLDENASDLSQGEDEGDYNDGMDYPADDGDVPMDDPEQPGDDPNEPQTPAHSPTPDRAAGTPPNAEQPNLAPTNAEQPNPAPTTNAEQPNGEQPNPAPTNAEQPNAAQPNPAPTNAEQPNAAQPNAEQPNAERPNAERANPEHNLPQAPTARKRGSKEAKLGNPNAKRRRTSSGTRRAEWKKKKAKEFRRRSNSGRRANTRGENGSTAAHESPFLADLKEVLRYEFNALNSNVGAGFSALNSNVTALNTNVTALNTNVTALNTNVTALNTNITAQNTNVGAEFSALNTNTTTGFSTLNSSVSAGFNALNSNVGAGFSALNTNVGAGFSALNTNIGALREENMNNRANQPQRGTEAGPQTNARGDDGAIDALGAGAIPRPVVAPDNGQAEGEDEAQAEAEISEGWHSYKWMVILTLIALLFIPYTKASQNDNIDASPSPDIQPPTINCDDGIEVASAFCREKKCVEDVEKYCLLERQSIVHGDYGKEKFAFKDEEDKIIARYI